MIDEWWQASQDEMDENQWPTALWSITLPLDHDDWPENYEGTRYYITEPHPGGGGGGPCYLVNYLRPKIYICVSDDMGLQNQVGRSVFCLKIFFLLSLEWDVYSKIRKLSICALMLDKFCLQNLIASLKVVRFTYFFLYDPQSTYFE